jgi:hypothetical protein
MDEPEDEISIRTSLSTRRPGNTKLEPEDVRCIRRLLELGWTQQHIADMMGVTRHAISDVKTGRQWGWVE